jgi:hypothetical protein
MLQNSSFHKQEASFGTFSLLRPLGNAIEDNASQVANACSGPATLYFAARIR